MLAGDPNRRTFDESDPAQDAVRYVCLGSNIPEGHGTTFCFLLGLELTRRIPQRTVQGWYASSDLFPSLLVCLSHDELRQDSDSIGTESIAGLKAPNMYLMGRVDLMVVGNALLPIPSESWVSSTSSSST